MIGCGIIQLSVPRLLDMDLDTTVICFLLTSLLVGTCISKVRSKDTSVSLTFHCKWSLHGLKI